MKRLLQTLAKRFFVAVLSVSRMGFAVHSEYTSCTSSICQETGEEIINGIDNTVDACTDFFQHACGAWIIKHPVPSSARSSDQFSVVERKVERDLKDLLENEAENNTGAIQKAKDFYKTCVDLATIDSKGMQPLMALLATNGDWPLTVPLSQWNPQHLTWQRIHENFMTITEYSGLFNLIVKVERDNSTARVITLTSQTMPRKRERLITLGTSDTSKRKAYKKYALSAALKLTKSRGLNVSNADVRADVKAMLKFESKLINASETGIKNELDNESIYSYRIATIKESQIIWNSAVNNDSQYEIDWLGAIRRRFKGTGIVIDENEKLALVPGIYFQRLGTLLAETPIRTIVNYIHWYAIEQLLTHGDRVMRRIEFEYLAHNEGIKDQLPRWRTCSKYHKMPHAISLFYAKKHFTGRSRASVLEMIRQLRQASKAMIGNSTWMKKNERKLAKAKIDAMVNKIGYPNWYDEPGKVDEYYSELTVGSDYFENVLAANRLDGKKQLLKLRKPASPAETDWIITPIEVNAGYDPSSNTLNFPAALLQMPIFHYEKPAALRFGGIGSGIGHEISHGFDNIGRIRDKNGNKRQWWSNSTINAYNKKTNCFIEQYNRYEITKSSITNETIYVNGVNTLGENLADNVGWRVGFKALQRYKNLHPNENVIIPLLQNYSDAKLYFYGLANLMCDVLQPEFLEHTYPTIWYAPSKVRINAALSNMEEFANTFGCRPGSNMNPTKKCLLWD